MTIATTSTMVSGCSWLKMQTLLQKHSPNAPYMAAFCRLWRQGCKDLVGTQPKVQCVSCLLNKLCCARSRLLIMAP